MLTWSNCLGNPQRPGDHTDPETGLLVCGVCGEAKQLRIDLPWRKEVVPVACRCVREENAARKEALAQEEAAYRLARRRTSCFGGDDRKAGFTFTKFAESAISTIDNMTGYGWGKGVGNPVIESSVKNFGEPNPINYALLQAIE
ncbi:MAG TPA: hypothetical protein H9915_04055 [Candidatus Gemmiger faecigallinarum]|nr:hypothetical protein [Candidatus Gemmiger faecigallinarum]